jgi:hypothetical protein
LLDEQADGEPDRAAGCIVGCGQLGLCGELAAWPQGAGGDLFTQVVGDLPVLGAGHLSSSSG